jgi:hypothetical protein
MADNSDNTETLSPGERLAQEYRQKFQGAMAQPQTDVITRLLHPPESGYPSITDLARSVLGGYGFADTAGAYGGGAEGAPVVPETPAAPTPAQPPATVSPSMASIIGAVTGGGAVPSAGAAPRVPAARPAVPPVVAGAGGPARPPEPTGGLSDLFGPRPAVPTMPTLPQVPEYKKPELGDLMKNPLLGLAMAFAGSATQNGLTNLLNTFSAASTSLQQGRKEDYELAMDKFEKDTGVVLKRFDVEQKNYENILNDRQMTIDEKVASLRMEAVRRNDWQLLQQLNAGFPQAGGLLGRRGRALGDANSAWGNAKGPKPRTTAQMRQDMMIEDARKVVAELEPKLAKKYGKDWKDKIRNILPGEQTDDVKRYIELEKAARRKTYEEAIEEQKRQSGLPQSEPPAQRIPSQTMSYPVPPQEAIDELRVYRNEERIKEEFDRVFGPGAAARALAD